MPQINKTLSSIGLNENQISVFTALLTLKDSLASTISRYSGLKRATTYAVLSDLKVKGLVSSYIRNKVTYFRAINPEILLESQKDKVKMLESVIPELLALNKKYSIQPQIQLFEGKEGIISIYEDSLNSKTEILGWADAELVLGEYLNDYYPVYAEKKRKRKVSSRVLLSYSELALELKENEEDFLREVFLIPKDKFPFKNEIDIYDDKMAIISHQDQVGVIIQNANIAEMQRSIFNFAFEYAKLIQDKLIKSKGEKY